MDKLKQRVKFLINRGNKLKKTYVPVPKVKLFSHSQHAGMAIMDEDGKFTIALNRELYTSDINFLLNEIIPHEVAHIIYFEKGVNDHRKGWRDLCKALGGSGNEIVHCPTQLFGRAIHYQYRPKGSRPIWLRKENHKLIQNSTKRFAVSDGVSRVIVRAAHYTGRTTKSKPQHYE